MNEENTLAAALNLDPKQVETGENFAKMTADDPESGVQVSGLLFAMMAKNVEEGERLHDQIIGWKDEKIAKLERELYEVRKELAAVRFNIEGLIYPDMSKFKKKANF